MKIPKQTLSKNLGIYTLLVMSWRAQDYCAMMRFKFVKIGVSQIYFCCCHLKRSHLMHLYLCSMKFPSSEWHIIHSKSVVFSTFCLFVMHRVPYAQHLQEGPMFIKPSRSFPP